MITKTIWPFQCPKCSSDNVHVQDPFLASDDSYIDCPAKCKDCEAELRVVYYPVCIEEEP